MTSSKEILQDILASAETNCVLKIKLSGQRNPVITAVDKVMKNSVMLKPTCLYGFKLKKRRITLPEIESVKRYRTRFNSPLFEKMRFVKNNLSEIRRNFEAFDAKTFKPGV